MKTNKFKKTLNIELEIPMVSCEANDGKLFKMEDESLQKKIDELKSKFIEDIRFQNNDIVASCEKYEIISEFDNFKPNLKLLQKYDESNEESYHHFKFQLFKEYYHTIKENFSYNSWGCNSNNRYFIDKYNPLDAEHLFGKRSVKDYVNHFLELQYLYAVLPYHKQKLPNIQLNHDNFKGFVDFILDSGMFSIEDEVSSEYYRYARHGYPRYKGWGWDTDNAETANQKINVGTALLNWCIRNDYEEGLTYLMTKGFNGSLIDCNPKYGWLLNLLATPAIVNTLIFPNMHKHEKIFYEKFRDVVLKWHEIISNTFPNLVLLGCRVEDGKEVTYKVGLDGILHVLKTTTRLRHKEFNIKYISNITLGELNKKFIENNTTKPTKKSELIKKLSSIDDEFFGTYKKVRNTCYVSNNMGLLGILMDKNSRSIAIKDNFEPDSDNIIFGCSSLERYFNIPIEDFYGEEEVLLELIKDWFDLKLNSEAEIKLNMEKYSNEIYEQIAAKEKEIAELKQQLKKNKR